MELLDWAYSMRSMLRPNGVSPHRFFRPLKELTDIPLVAEVGVRVLKAYGLENTKKEDGPLGSILSWHNTGGSVHEHTDDFNTGMSHKRFNLFLSLPISGGIPIYNGRHLDVEERMVVPYEADKILHSSTPVVGEKPRIIISYGWQFDKNDACF